jgi:hypothetical protein
MHFSMQYSTTVAEDVNSDNGRAFSDKPRASVVFHIEFPHCERRPHPQVRALQIMESVSTTNTPKGNVRVPVPYRLLYMVARAVY